MKTKQLLLHLPIFTSAALSLYLVNVLYPVTPVSRLFVSAPDERCHESCCPFLVLAARHHDAPLTQPPRETE